MRRRPSNPRLVPRRSGGWYLASSPIVTADWKVASGDKWLVPFGAGSGKLQRFGKPPANLSASAFWNAIHPENLPDASWTLRLQATVIL